MVGAWLGSGIVAGLPRRAIQIGMGFALLAAAVGMIAKQLALEPLGKEALFLATPQLVIAAIALAILGALMTIGVGLYAPCIVVISLLGMNQDASFPIMMGACAFLMPVASSRFVRRRAYSARPAVGLTLGGIPGVLLAVFVFHQLPVGWLSWLVVVIVVYTAILMLTAARREKLAPDAPGADCSQTHSTTPGSGKSSVGGRRWRTMNES